MSLYRSLPRILDRLLEAVRRVSRAAVVAGGVLMLIAAFMIAADVVLRRVLGLSTWGASELSYYALAISTSWALAFAMLDKAHVRIAVLTERLSLNLRAACDLVALLAMGFFALLASQAAFSVLARSWRRGSTSITSLETPLWIPQGLWLLGFVFFTVVVVLILLRLIASIVIERAPETAERWSGAPTIQSETEAAIAEAASQRRDPA